MRATLLRTLIALQFAVTCLACTSMPPKETEYNLGVQSYRSKDYAAARQHWTRAVEAHELDAYNNLGYLLYFGLGGEPDPARAVLLWTEAAKGGHAESQWHLGQAFEDGKGTEKNIIEAFAWYRCATETAQAASALDDIDARVAQDASQSLVRILPKLTGAQFETSKKLAESYIAKYTKLPGN